MHLMPLYEKIVVKIDDKQELKSKGGLTYTANMSISANTAMKGKVVAVGEGRLLSNGEIIPLKVKVGDTVIYNKIQGDTYTEGNENYTIMSESSIMAIVKEDNNENN